MAHEEKFNYSSTQTQLTHSALELGAGQTQTTCSEHGQAPLLLLHHGETVTISPATNKKKAHIVRSVLSERLSVLFISFIYFISVAPCIVF